MNATASIAIVSAMSTIACASGPSVYQPLNLTELQSTYHICRNQEPATGCGSLVAQAMKVVYGIRDFEGAPGATNAATVRQIEISEHWQWLGPASEQTSLTKAQQLANAGKAVVAVGFDTVPPHLAIILPGVLKKSSGWAMRLPNSMSYIASNPKASYVNKKLSYAFRKPSQVVLYRRKY